MKQNTDDHGPTISMALAVTLLTSLVTAVSMTVYAAFQYFGGADRSVSHLFIHHAWHVLGMGVLTYAVVYAALYALVLRPINQLYLKCYAITRGDLAPVAVQSRLAEIHTIADGINMMQEEMTAIPRGVASRATLETAAQGLRLIVANDAGLSEDSAAYLVDTAGKLEGLAAGK